MCALLIAQPVGYAARYPIITPHQAVGADYAVGARVHDTLHTSLGPGTVVHVAAGPAHSSVETRVRFDGGKGVFAHVMFMFMFTFTFMFMFMFMSMSMSHVMSCMYMYTSVCMLTRYM